MSHSEIALRGGRYVVVREPANLLIKRFRDLDEPWVKVDQAGHDDPPAFVRPSEVVAIRQYERPRLSSEEFDG